MEPNPKFGAATPSTQPETHLCLSCGNEYELGSGGSKMMACTTCQDNSPCKSTPLNGTTAPAANGTARALGFTVASGATSNGTASAPVCDKAAATKPAAKEEIPAQKKVAAKVAADKVVKADKVDQAPKVDEAKGFLGALLDNFGTNNFGTLVPGGNLKSAAVDDGKNSPEFSRRRSSLVAELEDMHEDMHHLETELEVMHWALAKAALERYRTRRGVLTLLLLLLAAYAAEKLHTGACSLPTDLSLNALLPAIGGRLPASIGALNIRGLLPAFPAGAAFPAFPPLTAPTPEEQAPLQKGYVEEALGDYYPSSYVDSIYAASIWPFTVSS
mmetsp:Transcript_56265/g.133608  ORF Transcript_56265/g.133608 Transcript_56265/m.133608 type:complete len:330 (-) Transcript_56265:51-1040(-)